MRSVRGAIQKHRITTGRNLITETTTVNHPPPMMTLDLTTTRPEAIVAALCQISADKAATIQREGALRALKSRERGLQAELNDVRERITIIECGDD